MSDVCGYDRSIVQDQLSPAYLYTTVQNTRRNCKCDVQVCIIKTTILI